MHQANVQKYLPWPPKVCMVSSQSAFGNILPLAHCAPGKRATCPLWTTQALSILSVFPAPLVSNALVIASRVPLPYPPATSQIPFVQRGVFRSPQMKLNATSYDLSADHTVLILLIELFSSHS